jgi:hypothetical protein
MALQSAAISLPSLLAYARRERGWGDCVRAIGAAQRRRFRRRLLFASVLHPFFLERRRQSCLAALVGSHLVPFRAFYAALH